MERAKKWNNHLEYTLFLSGIAGAIVMCRTLFLDAPYGICIGFAAGSACGCCHAFCFRAESEAGKSEPGGTCEFVGVRGVAPIVAPKAAYRTHKHGVSAVESGCGREEL